MTETTFAQGPALDADLVRAATSALYAARGRGEIANDAAAAMVRAVAPLVEARVRAAVEAERAETGEAAQRGAAPRMRRHVDGRFAVEAVRSGEWHIFQVGTRRSWSGQPATVVAGPGWVPVVPPRIDLAALAASIASCVGEEFPNPEREMMFGQGLSLSEEAGELVSAALAYSVSASQVNAALRRMLGIARRSGSKAELEGELADAFITLFMVAHYARTDPWAAVAAKVEVIFSRGWREVPVS